MAAGTLFIFLCIFVFLGVVFLALGLLLRTIRQRKIALCTRKTVAVVKENISRVHYRHGEAARFYWYPVIRYWAEGREIEKTMSFGQAGSPRYPVGAEVTVFYQPEDPKNCYIENDNTTGLVSAVFLCVGLGLLFLGLLFGIVFFGFSDAVC